MLLALQILGWNRQNFTLDDKDFQIFGGEIDLIKVPYQYWEQRVKASKAMGLNTMAVQLNWNAIELANQTLDFKSDQNNLENFILICQKHSMQIILRPGPESHYYTSVGGLPMRMHYDNVTVRDFNDKVWSDSVDVYIAAIAEIVIKYNQAVSMIQLEQLAGLDKLQTGYTNWLRQIYIKYGVFGPFMQLEATVDTYGMGGTALGLSGSPNEYELQFAMTAWPNSPVFYGNLYTGDATYYFSGSPVPRHLNLKPIIAAKQSFVLMFMIGGTNFGLEASGVRGNTYMAYTTSNDFGAPLSENGYPTPAFIQHQKAITGANAEFEVVPTQSIGAFNMTKTGTLKGQGFNFQGTFKTLPTFESFRQKQGLGIYDFLVEPHKNGMLAIEQVRDYAMVYVDGVLVHTFDRSKTPDFNHNINSGHGKIRIVVDTMGHHGHSGGVPDDKKGIWGKILFDNVAPTEFNVSTLPIENFHGMDVTEHEYQGGLFRGQFESNSSADTYLDFAQFNKGYVFVNGYNLGRYWNVNNDIAKNHYSRLYCPGVYLKEGINKVVVLDVLTTEEVIEVSGFDLAFKCAEGYVEVGTECIKE